jgi:UDP-N-acetylglucosamine 4,6-dehydratase/5-epimerase
MRTFDESLPDLRNANVLVTGGTGSFGRQFVTTLVEHFAPRRIVVFSRDEMKQYDMEQSLSPKGRDTVRFFIGDVRDAGRLEMAMRDVQYVIHAAALKHVPAAEYNPFECVRTNIHGAENIVSAALRTRVRRVIALSTDKAVNPINLYGATKLAADKIFVAANSLAGSQDTRFAVVRYGNVVASRGSVVPLFLRLAEQGAADIPITDPRMTRFWISLQQGVNFVLSSLQMMKGGEIFVPKIPSMRLVDLATAIAPELPQRIVGIRPGEKIHEVMISEDDARTTVELPDRYIIQPPFHAWSPNEPWAREGNAVADDFRYASDSNREWIDKDALLSLIAPYRRSAGTPSP